MPDKNFQNEELNQSILEKMIQDHIDGFEDWNLNTNEGNILVDFIDQNDQEQTITRQTYAELIDYFSDALEEDFMNHNDYLDETELQYLQENGLDIGNSLERQHNEPVIAPEEVSGIPEQKEPVQNKTTSFSELSKKIENQISIVDVVRESGYNIKRNGTTTYTTEEHNSLVLDPKTNRFYWNSRPPLESDVEKARKRIDKTGRGTIPQCLSGGVLTFYMTEHNVSWKEAVAILGKRIDPDLDIQIKLKEVSPTKSMNAVDRHKFLMEQLNKNHYQNKDMRNVKAYLIQTRKIDPEIVDLFIQRNMLFQTQDDKGRTQAAFIGKDENGMLSYVSFRSTSSNSKFKGDYSGCNYDRGCYFEPQMDIPFGWKDDPNHKPVNTNKRLLVFESNIEMMSYMSLLKLNQVDYNHFAYLSCGSISKTSCVHETCKIYGYDKVVVMFNNDKEKKNNPGLTKAKHLTNELRKEGIEAYPLVPSQCNDWNDTLIAYKDHQIQLEKFKTPQKEEPKKARGQPVIGVTR